MPAVNPPLLSESGSRAAPHRGSARSLEDADRLLGARQLTLHPLPGIVSTAAGQAAILTAAATAVRTFGAVHVTLPDDTHVRDGVHRGHSLSDALRREGAHVDESSSNPDATVIVLGGTGNDVSSASGGLVLHASWDGWIAAVSPALRPAAETGNVLTAIAAAALAVSEAFAHARALPGNDAGYRTLQLNLLGRDATSGPDLQYAPAS